MKLFCCRRGKNRWEGSLLIYAASKEEAATIFYGEESEEPYSTKEIVLEHGILYDDYMR